MREVVGIEFQYTHPHMDSYSLFLSLSLSPDPNHCQFVGLAGEVGDLPCVIEGHPVPAVTKVIVPRPACLDTLRGSGKNKASVHSVIVSGLGPDTSIAIFIVTCSTSSWSGDVTIVVNIGILGVPDSCN